VRRLLTALAIVALAITTLSPPAFAATSTPTTTTPAAGRSIKVTGKAFSFSPKKITLRAGERVTIVLTSTDVIHDLVVQGVGRVVVAKAGKTKRGTLMIGKPGKYKMWCRIRGHRSAGMTGTVIAQ
jgi:plastocyanin